MMETPINHENGIPGNDATDEETIECKGDFCSHSSFKVSQKGCNPIAKLCPLCVKEMERSLAGKHL